MASTLPGASPLQTALSQLGALPEQERARLAQSAFETVAKETKVPANVLMALDEAAGGSGDHVAARKYADVLSGLVAKGGTLEDAITQLTGDPASARTVMDRSYDIADALYPASPQPKPAVDKDSGPGLLTDIADTGKALLGGAVNATGSAVNAAGVVVDEALRRGIETLGSRQAGETAQPVEGDTFARRAGRAAGEAIQDGGNAILDTISDRGKEAMKGFQPSGDLTDPSTWTLGDNPSLRGAALQTAQGMGSMAPVVAAGVATGGAGAAIMGGLMSGGEGADNGRQFVLDAANTLDEKGQPEIAKLPQYRRMISEGMTHEQATEELARAAENNAGFRQAIPGALGGAATNRIMTAAGGWLGSGGRVARAAKKGAAGFVEEGVQETAEGMGSNSGISAATGADIDVMDDSFSNFVLGGLAGGGMGVVGGAVGGASEDGDKKQTDGMEGLPALPAPDDPAGAINQDRPAGLLEYQPDTAPGFGATPMDASRRAAPDQVTAQSTPLLGHDSSQQNAEPGGSGPGAVATPPMDGPLADPAGGVAALPVQPDEQPAPPAGPIEVAARMIAPTPEPEPTPEPVVRFPEQKPGASVRLGDEGTGQIFEGVFLRETPSGVAIRLNGEEYEISPQEFDAGVASAAAIEAAQAAQAALGPQVDPVPVTPDPAPTPEPSHAPGDDAVAKVQELQKRIAFLNDTGRTNGWDQRMVAAKQAAETELANLIGLPPLAEAPQAAERPTPAATIEDMAPDVDDADERQPTSPQVEAPAPSIEHIRSRAAIIRNMDDVQPDVPGVSFKKDDRAGGWVFSRKHEDAVRKALSIPVPASEQVEAAAAQAQPEPTEAQKEAGNYKKGHMSWNGLNLTIENAKGSERKGVDPSGEAWSVTMPGHYGYFKRTEGADGDHVDFYMGDAPDADYAMIVDQVDADTGEFDEHKIIIGTMSRGDALGIYRAGFSDGRADARIGGYTETTVSTLKAWLESGDTKKPVKPMTFPFKAQAEQDPIEADGAAKPDTSTPDDAGQIEGARGFPPPETDFLSDSERWEDVRDEVDRQLQALNLQDVLTRDERQAIITKIDRYGGFVEDEIYDVVVKGERSRTDTDEESGPEPDQEVSDIPFGTERGGEQSRPEPGGSQGSAPESNRPAGPDQRPAQPDEGRVSPKDTEPAKPDAAQAVDYPNRKLGFRKAASGPDAQYDDQAFANIAAANLWPGDVIPAPASSLFKGDAEVQNVTEKTLIVKDRATNKVLRIAPSGAKWDQFARDAGGLLSATQHGVDGGDLLVALKRDPAFSYDESGIMQLSDTERGAKDAPDKPRILKDLPDAGDESEIAGDLGGTEAMQRAALIERGFKDTGGAWAKNFDGLLINVRKVAGVWKFTATDRRNGVGVAPSTVAAQGVNFFRALAEYDGFIEQKRETADPTPVPEPAPKPKTKKAKKKASNSLSKPGKSQKIEDFGEHLAGARKDTWGVYAERMSEAEALAIGAVPLSKSWPAPDYKKLIADGVDPVLVAFIRTARDGIPNKPSSAYRVRQWVKQVEPVRAMAFKLLSGEVSAERLIEVMDADPNAYRAIRHTMDLYLSVGHEISLKGMTMRLAEYTVHNGVRYGFGNELKLWEVQRSRAATAFGNMPHTVATGKTKEKAIEAFKSVHAKILETPAPKRKGKKPVKLRVWSEPNPGGGDRLIFVGVKPRNEWIALRQTPDVAEARRAVKEDYDELVEQYEKMRDIPNERRDKNEPRVGDDFRQGADVHPDQFAETFGFRGVQFGNWVEGDRRQEDLNNAYDGLMDMALILGLEPKALSLNGSLGLAFGARGSGGKNPAAAHYEPDSVVINLTKKAGRGSLAHEWFHALDNYFGRARTDKVATRYITDNKRPGSAIEGVRPEVTDAFLAVRHAIDKTDMKQRNQKLDKLRSSPYWATGIEMHARAFESYVLGKLHDQSLSNDYLVNLVNGTLWGKLAELQGGEDSYPYLYDNELEIVRPAFDALFDQIQTRASDTGLEMYSKIGQTRPVVAELTGDELGATGDIADLRKATVAWYRANLAKTSSTMDATGWNVRFASGTAGKFGGRKGRDLLRIVPALPAIIEKGTLISSLPSRKAGDRAKAFHKIAARVTLAGEPKDVIVTVREMADGMFHYDLSRDTGDGAKFMATGFPVADAGAESRNAAQTAPVALNLQFDEARGNAFVQSKALRGVSSLAGKILTAHGLEGKVEAKAVKRLLSASGVTVLGSYSDGTITVNAEAADPAHVAHHEIIHALRDRTLWGKDYGLFTAPEWRALVRAAKAESVIRSAVGAAYPELNATAKNEEMVAEFYADWARSKADAPDGPLGRALERMKALFRALSAALRGEGFLDAALIMEKIQNGAIGARGAPDGNGPDGGRRMEKRGSKADTKAFKQWFGGSKAVDRNGVPLVLYHGTDKDFDAFEGVTFATVSAELAEGYGEGYGQRVIPVNMAIQNPATGSDVIRVAQEQDGWDSDFEDEYPGTILMQVPGTIEALKAEGFDGAEFDDGPGGWSDAADAPTWVAFTPEQVKSIFNDGSYNPKDPQILHQKNLGELKDRLQRSKGKALGMIGTEGWNGSAKIFGKWMGDKASASLTDAMGRNDRFNMLATVPGYALFSELGKNLPAAQEYLKLKQRMDADRNKWQARSAEMVDKWTKTARKNPKANAIMMELMHDSTRLQIDPSKAQGWRRPDDDDAARVGTKATAERKAWAKKVRAEEIEREKEYLDLRKVFNKLPKEFKALYSEVRDEYSALADEADKALQDHIKASAAAALDKARREHRKERQRIKEDKDLTVEERAEALGKANEKWSAAEARAARAQGTWMQHLRQLFESKRLAGPYFPLSRFGNYFVTIRDENDQVESFDTFETKAEQDAFVAEAKKQALGKVQRGVLSNDADTKSQVDPRFVSDIEGIMDEAGASSELMDAVWMRYLESMPQSSMRKHKIHRKGRAGYSKDAVRAFASAMFHGAHQTARLRYGAQMEEKLNVAEDQAGQQSNPERAGFIVREMKQRHAFTMQPTNNPLVTMATSLAFVWYLGISPAAALVNISQTTVVGVPIMSARFRKAGVKGTIEALGKASMDFMHGRGKVTKRVKGVPVMTDMWSVENAPNLTDDERKAMDAGYENGVIDKTQSHDLASVADSGVEYNPAREKAMRVIGWAFHHAERFNREVTYLAAYRMARSEGLSHDAAVSSASAMVWKVHFDYSNTSKPRAMQGDAAKILTIFRNFTVNMLFRLFRDTHQALSGASADDKREARAQLIGVTLSMMAHAGIRGVWGYSLIMGLLGLFFPGDGDDMDEWLQDALLMEGDNLGVAAWNWTMGLALSGVPGHALGINLTNRIGMPNLWFQSSDKDLEGQDLWNYYLQQIAGPAVGMIGNVIMGASTIADGQTVRGIEKMSPVFLRNAIRSGRYATEGVTTYNGDPLIEEVSPWQLLSQFSGFTPAEVSERYKINNRLKNEERKIADRRQAIIRSIGDAVRAGQVIPDSAREALWEFNTDFPEWPIMAKDVSRSVKNRARASTRNELGVSLNPKLNNLLREQRAPALYD